MLQIFEDSVSSVVQNLVLGSLKRARAQALADYHDDLRRTDIEKELRPREPLCIDQIPKSP